MKYHNTNDGPRPCTAKKKCPLGGTHYSNYDAALKGYGEDLQREHSNLPQVAKKPSDRVVTTGKVQGLNGNSYYGCAISDVPICKFREEWATQVGMDKMLELEANKAGRVSGSSYHMTAITPKELRSLRGEVTPPPDASEIECVGIGTITSGENTAWYVVCRSPQVDSWRSENGLGPKDFHVTLGFEPKDVYDKFKGENTLI